MAHRNHWRGGTLPDKELIPWGNSVLLKTTIALCATLFLCVTANAAQYGAIAFSPKTGAIGYSTKGASRGNAQDWAMYYCGQYARDCKIAVNFNNACGALAIGRNGGWGADWGYTRAEAEADALTICRRHDTRCRVKRSACNPGN
ncbi:DUF4189 domain-containing protein [Devosia sp. 2618]|uniref:DUF4189 domain-containing protein n=1 Tax=Devosia sp. 2618 TaxID=3156454 RepID=UPI003399E27F